VLAAATDAVAGALEAHPAPRGGAGPSGEQQQEGPQLEPAATVAAAHALARLAWAAPRLLRALAAAAEERGIDRSTSGASGGEGAEGDSAPAHGGGAPWLLGHLDARGACMLAWAAALQYVLSAAGKHEPPVGAGGGELGSGEGAAMEELRAAAAGVVAGCVARAADLCSEDGGGAAGGGQVGARPRAGRGLGAEGGAQLHHARVLLNAACGKGNPACWAALGDDADAAAAICRWQAAQQGRGLLAGEEAAVAAVLRVARGAWAAAQRRKRVSATQRDVLKVGGRHTEASPRHALVLWG
jgi:hypothetical protein